MKQIQISSLIDIASSGVEDPEARIQKLFEWRFDHAMSVAKWALGLAASLVVVVLVAYFRAPTNIDLTELGYALLAAFISGSYGVYVLFRLRSINAEFVSALTLLARLRDLAPFVIRFRSWR